MMNTEYILLRSPRTKVDGHTKVSISMVKRDSADLSGYSFLRHCKDYDEWVPTEELSVYKKVFGVE